MSIGILYESDEWSVRHLHDLLNGAGIDTALYNLEMDRVAMDQVLRSRLIVNRLFPSAPLRGYASAFQTAGKVLRLVKVRRIPMINSYEAYAFDCSKLRSGRALREAGLPVPNCYAAFRTPGQVDPKKLSYPCMLKPDCSGRSLYTYIIKSRTDLEKTLAEVPSRPFLVQQYIEPVKGYTTRVEIVGDELMSVMKRSAGKNALSSYHAGSVFQAYPDCPKEILQASVLALNVLSTEMGSLDIIESGNGSFYIIDVNATSNFSEDNLKMMGFDPIQIMVDYLVERYRTIL